MPTAFSFAQSQTALACAWVSNLIVLIWLKKQDQRHFPQSTLFQRYPLPLHFLDPLPHPTSDYSLFHSVFSCSCSHPCQTVCVNSAFVHESRYLQVGFLIFDSSVKLKSDQRSGWNTFISDWIWSLSWTSPHLLSSPHRKCILRDMGGRLGN